MDHQLRNLNLEGNNMSHAIKFLLRTAMFLTLATISCSHRPVDYFNGGVGRQAKGDWDGAIADFTKAIQLKPNDASAYNNRGRARNATGDVEGAGADYAKAIELNPKYAWAWHNRGCLRYDARDFTAASADFRKALECDSSNDYARFRLCLTRAWLGEPAAAATELQTYLAGPANAQPDRWPSKMGLFLAGPLAEPEFLAAARNADPSVEARQLCQAYFYAGSKHLLAGDKSAAMDYFQKSIAAHETSCLEYASAVAASKSLKEQKNQDP